MSTDALPAWGAIEVRGAHENNLRDVSLDIPKRRLTVFTGVSGSGKSSLVFQTIAAESRRLINETYTAFLQSYMGTPARPDVDSLEGLTVAIVVDQERMGANPRSTVGTATDAHAMLRIAVQPPRTAAHRAGQRVLVQHPSAGTASGAITLEKRGGLARDVEAARHQRRDVRRVRGPRPRLDHRHRRARGPQPEPQRGRDHVPQLPAGNVQPEHLRASRACSTPTGPSATTRTTSSPCSCTGLAPARRCPGPTRA